MIIDAKILQKIKTFDTTYQALRFVTVAVVPMEMAETLEHFRPIPPIDAGLAWRSVTVGDQWGCNWSTAWLRGSVTIPESVHDQAVFLRAATGADECLLLVDGRHQGVFDEYHPIRLLTLKATAGTRHDVHLEAYAGHAYPGTQPFDTALEVAGGASQDGNAADAPQRHTFETVEIVAERADVSAFVFDLRTLSQLASSLEESSLRRSRILTALQHMFEVVYAKPAEVEESRWRVALDQAREAMRPLLALKNGPTAPEFGIIGHSHIDTAWLWPLAETYRKLARTFSSVLNLMDQYPEFQFTMSAAYHADVVRRLYPEIFTRIQERVQEGRWEINGAMWVEPDCNIPSGESFVRQCLAGQRATREMFGVTSDTLWQPDVFGYSAALPQILRGCGIEYFCTTKLSWNDTNRFPYDTFVWQGIDGSTVLAHFNATHCWPDAETLSSSWKQVQHPDVQDRRLMTFGYGDGGGGPMSEMIEMAQRVQDLEGCPRTAYASITKFMTGVKDDLHHLPRWVGELYLELHRGTLTSIAPIKRFNRKCEFALRDAEFTAAVATLRKGATYPADALLEAWKGLMVNQFHDILPGSSIARVNDEACAAFAHCWDECRILTASALSALAGRAEAEGDALLLSNSLSWERGGEIELAGVPPGMQPEAVGGTAQEFEDVQGTRRLAITGLELPPLGYRVVPLMPLTPVRTTPFVVTQDTVETPFAQVRFNEAGQIVSFFDRTAGRELVTAGGAFNVLLLGEDVPLAWDNWDIDRDQRLKLEPQNDLVKRSVVADGPLQLRIRQEYRIGRQSEWTQDIVFHATTPRVDFDTHVEWKEKYQFLKVGFSVDVLADTARHEIQFGHVTRTTHDNTTWDRAQFDVCAHKWTDISETEYGVAFLNDCKYACTIKDGHYRLSLIKSGRHPDPRGDEGKHLFSYAMLPHSGGFSAASVVRPAYEFNLPPLVHSAADTGAEFSLASVNVANVIVEAVKWAEDGDGLIMRLYEAGGTGRHADLRLGLPVQSVVEVNLLEEKQGDIALSDGLVSLYFRPFQIRTLKLMLT